MEEDKKLYNQFLNGNEESFQKLITKYEKNLIYFITRYVKNLDIAYDIYQDTIMYILEHKEKYNDNYSFKTYLYLIAKSRAINYINSKTKNLPLENFENTLKEERLLEDIVFSKERQEKIEKVIKKLKEEYQLVIYLTKIEGLSYKETSLIMDKTEKQIKNLVFNATKKLKKLLVQEKIIEIKNNKFIRLLLWFIVLTFLISSLTYAGVIIYEKYKASLVPTYTEEFDNSQINNMWVCTFNLAWNEFMDERFGGEVKFKNETPSIVNSLNKKDFTKDQLSENSYYIKVDVTRPELKEIIKNDIINKFNIDETSTLDKINFDIPNSYTIYSFLYKKFEFKTPFDVLDDDKFSNSEEKVKYFGITASSSESLREQVEVIFYNDQNNFAIKLNTKNNEDIILARIDSTNSFDETYNTIVENSKYEKNKSFNNEDTLKIPNLIVDTEISYDELCNRELANNKNNISYIKSAIQQINFSLNNEGGEVISRGIIQDITKANSIKRNFNFTDNFYLFLKETDKEKPYLMLKVDNTDLIEISN